MKRVVEITASAPPGALLLVPVPFGHWGQVCDAIDVTGAAGRTELVAENGRQRALLLEPAGETVTLRYGVRTAERAAPDWVWEIPESRFNRAAADLVAEAASLAGQGTASERLRRLAEEAARIFDYGHVAERFHDGHEAVPMLCGTTRGSCVDINTWLLAAALSAGIRGQYIAGYWFGPGRTTTPDMHCWLAFDTGAAEPEFWDVAHHLKWGVEGFGPGLNPAGGRRIAMACGRGLRFATPHGAVTLSHFSEPVTITPDGSHGEGTLAIRLEESLEEPTA